jgi:hypothetical protein
VRSRLFGSLTALLLAGGVGLAQAPGPAGRVGPGDTLLPPPRPELVPAPAAGSLLPLVVPPPAVAAGGEGLAGCEPFPDTDGYLCGPPGRVHVDAEYLLWWTKGQRLPALVTGGSTADTVPGALGQPGTVEIFGDNTVDDRVRSGARFGAGVWITDDQTIGIDGSVFFLQPQFSHFAAASNGSLLLARPFFAVGTVTLPDGTQQDLAQEDALLLASPGVSTGRVRVSTSNHFWGADVDARVNLCGDCFYRVDLLAGFRYLEVKDALGIASVSDTIPPSGPTTVSDTFTTTSRFYGGQIGAAADFCRGCWFVDFRGTLDLGAMSRDAEIGGSTTTTANGSTSVVRGGLFAQPTNIGHHTNVAFGVVPEGSCVVGYQINRYLRASVGYSLIYLARNVALAGDQIDRVVNVNQIAALGRAPLVGDIRPAISFVNNDFWAQGFQFGLEFDF